MYYGSYQSKTEIGNTQEVTGGTGELNKTNEITGAVVGAGNTAIGYAILLILLLLILLDLSVMFQHQMYIQHHK